MSPEDIAAKILGEVQPKECQEAITRCIDQMNSRYKIGLTPEMVEAWLANQ